MTRQPNTAAASVVRASHFPINTAAADPASYVRYWPNGITGPMTWEGRLTANAAAAPAAGMVWFNWPNLDRNDPPPDTAVLARI